MTSGGRFSQKDQYVFEFDTLGTKHHKVQTHQFAQAARLLPAIQLQTAG